MSSAIKELGGYSVSRKKDLNWNDAIAKILNEESEPVHYARIADLISERGYRTELGATPASTVASVLSTELKKANTVFERVSKGTYTTKDRSAAISTTPEPEEGPAGGVIQCMGVFWENSKVNWNAKTEILGKQQEKSLPIDFGEQVGVYFLHDRHRTIYVGQALKQSLAKRLVSHRRSRLSGRWDRFSWFGMRPVDERGDLGVTNPSWDTEAVVDALEAVLIEGIEPTQNRRQGDGFAAIEYQQDIAKGSDADTSDKLLLDYLKNKG